MERNEMKYEKYGFLILNEIKYGKPIYLREFMILGKPFKKIKIKIKYQFN